LITHFIGLTFASHINVAATLSWSICHVTKNSSHYLSQIEKEIEGNSFDAIPSFRQLNQIQLFDNMMKGTLRDSPQTDFPETLRLYAGGAIAPRVAQKNYEIGGFEIPKVSVCIRFSALNKA
jgi:cytochrome P450